MFSFQILHRDGNGREGGTETEERSYRSSKGLSHPFGLVETLLTTTAIVSVVQMIVVFSSSPISLSVSLVITTLVVVVHRHTHPFPVFAESFLVVASCFVFICADDLDGGGGLFSEVHEASREGDETSAHKLSNEDSQIGSDGHHKVLQGLVQLGAVLLKSSKFKIEQRNLPNFLNKSFQSNYNKPNISVGNSVPILGIGP